MSKGSKKNDQLDKNKGLERSVKVKKYNRKKSKINL